jgi:hypothetical protein
VSDGGAGVIAELLRIPVLREITLAVLWYVSLLVGLQEGVWSWFLFMSLVGVVVAGIHWFVYNRDRKDTGGGLKLLLVLLVMLVLFPLLIVSWRRRRAKEQAHA